MSREPSNDEQAAAQRSVERAFPAVAAFLTEAQDARPDADLMRGDAPQVTDAEALDAYREFYEEVRTHTVRLLDAPGSTMTVRCPSWCASDHAEDETHGTFAADFAHRGGEEALHVDLGDGDAEDVLICEITHYPFSSSDLRTPTVVMWPTLGMTEGHLDAPKLFGLADQLRQYATALDEVAIDLQNAQEETEEARRADLKERWAR
ncbi:DUF6907 domain-containing protein [Streptomyces europaeiscabiei]|uniref:DUF6907 domain-containing protein n=1 Tax=Streptomyces europaeiscabiei TaxID=146819 RepID=UPI000E6A7B39|nr:hypothetical protein [Streptomyces europaeiscabiei]